MRVVTDLAYGGGGPQHIKLPNDQGSRPPTRVPDQPPGDGRFICEKIIKWVAIAIVALFLLIAFGMFASCEREPTRRQAQATAKADHATQEAVDLRIRPNGD